MSHVLRRVHMCWEREDIFVGPCVLLGAGQWRWREGMGSRSGSCVTPLCVELLGSVWASRSSMTSVLCQAHELLPASLPLRSAHSLMFLCL